MMYCRRRESSKGFRPASFASLNRRQYRSAKVYIRTTVVNDLLEAAILTVLVQRNDGYGRTRFCPPFFGDDLSVLDSMLEPGSIFRLGRRSSVTSCKGSFSLPAASAHPLPHPLVQLGSVNFRVVLLDGKATADEPQEAKNEVLLRMLLFHHESYPDASCRRGLGFTSAVLSVWALSNCVSFKSLSRTFPTSVSSYILTLPYATCSCTNPYLHSTMM